MGSSPSGGSHFLKLCVALKTRAGQLDRASAGLRQHRDEGWNSFQVWATIRIAVGASGAIQDRARDFEAAIDRGGTRGGRHAGFDKRIERLVINLLRIEGADEWLEQRD